MPPPLAPWKQTLWQSSCPARIEDVRQPTAEVRIHVIPLEFRRARGRLKKKQQFQEAQDNLSTATTQIGKDPVALLARLRRAGVFLQLGYPELAAGDAYKLCLLCKAARRNEGHLGRRVRSGLSAVLQALSDP
ncbi:hypothetical protein LTR98_011760, partial [Exophiala xenobiotica]